jgi:hypothetical protein
MWVSTIGWRSAAIDKEDAVSRLSLVRMNLLTGEIPLQYCK